MSDRLLALDTDRPIWDHFYTVAPLVVVGTKEGDGYDLAPKHMVTPLGYGNWFGFVCTPRHSTYHNVLREEAFTVSFPNPSQVLVTALAASPRCGEGEGAEGKPTLDSLPTFMGERVDAPLLEDAYLYLECALERIVEGFDENCLICGRIVAAHVDRKAVRVSEGDDQQMIFEHPMLAYLAYGRFAKISESYAFPFPKGFKV